MCGRFTVTKPVEELEKRFDMKDGFGAYTPRYNAAPTEWLPVITNEHPLVLQLYRWGLVPFWAKDDTFASRTINARIETLQEKASFKAAFKYRHCLVFADGYYEWKTEGKTKQPYRIVKNGGELFAMAGLWEHWTNPLGVLYHSFTIITLPALPSLAHLHERMPAILRPQHEKKWLSGTYSPQQLMELLQQVPDAAQFTSYPVSQAVNRAGHDSPNLVQPI